MTPAPQLRPGDFTAEGHFVDRDGAVRAFGCFYMLQGREALAKKHGWKPVELCEGGQFIAEKLP